MSIPEDFLWRGCSSAYTEPIREEEEMEAVHLVDMVVHTNPRFTIEFRHGIGDHDRIHHVFRWSREPVEQIFRDGFQARNVHNTPDERYFNLEYYVNEAGVPLAERTESFAFISTTTDSGWRPHVQSGTHPVYRYEIYAPGGIHVVETLGAACRFPNQSEVAFVLGIAPQYIRSAQRFRPRQSNNTWRLSLERTDRDLLINRNFNPRPDVRLQIQRPVRIYIIYIEGERRGVPLNQVFPDIDQDRREKRQVATTDLDTPFRTTDPDTLVWYSATVADAETTWISAAFRSSSGNEAYIFMNNEYVLINYAPGTTGDWIVNGPLSLYDGFPSLAPTVFAEWGIDCAFRSHYGNEAFIFCGNRCACIDFAPGTTDDKILQGPMTIARMFPFFIETVFEKGIDAAFEATARGEAYLFKGDQYALINYRSPRLIAIRPITQGFHSLRGTIFATGIDAAFASSRKDEAYLFKGDSYALINFAPGTTNDYLLSGGVKKILPNWPSLRPILPRNNQGDDVHEHALLPRDDHDEL